jgi:hypothetical protein
MTVYEARQQAIADGAKFFKYQTYEKYDYSTSLGFGWHTHTFYDLEYYFSEDGQEVGYYCRPTKSYCKISRKWGPEMYNKLVERHELRVDSPLGV